jgi:hypothetical protein
MIYTLLPVALSMASCAEPLVEKLSMATTGFLNPATLLAVSAVV